MITKFAILNMMEVEGTVESSELDNDDDVNVCVDIDDPVNLL